MTRRPKPVSRSISRRALDNIDLDAETSSGVPATADTRPAALDKMMTVSGELLDTVREVFSGTKVAEDESLLRVVIETRQAVGQAWERAARSFLEIGRVLNALDSALSDREEKARLKAGFEKIFPFSDPVASQFRRVAQMVDSGRVTEDILPGSYSAAYQVALLEREDLEEAQRRGLIGPHTSRSSLIAFRRERSRPASSRVDLKALLAEQRQLREKRRRMVEELAGIRRRFREIARLLDE